MRLSLIFALIKKKKKKKKICNPPSQKSTLNFTKCDLHDAVGCENPWESITVLSGLYAFLCSIFVLFISYPVCSKSQSCCLVLHTGCQYSREGILPGLVTSELSHRVNCSRFLRLKWRICIDYLVFALFFVSIMWAAQHPVKVCLVFQRKASILYLVTSKFSLKSVKPEGKHSELDGRPWFRLQDT